MMAIAFGALPLAQHATRKREHGRKPDDLFNILRPVLPARG
jgi:N6-adenosine-specific RNA methylase IME4